MGIRVSLEGGSVQSDWSQDENDYQLFLYHAVNVVKTVFGSTDFLVIGSLAMNAYFRLAERRLVTGLDVALPAVVAAQLLKDPALVAEKLNAEIKRRGYSDKLVLNGFPFELGVFEPVRNTVNGKVRLVAVVKGGYSTFKEACKIAPKVGSKAAMLEGKAHLFDARLSPLFFELKVWSNGQADQNMWLVHRSSAQKLLYFNAASERSGMPPVEIKVPSLETLVACKLNMIYQSSVNERLIRATPLSAHHAAKSCRPKASPADIYDFVTGSKQVKTATLRKILQPIVTEPVNAMLDMTAEAVKKIGSTKVYEELNVFMPKKRWFDQKSWKTVCEDALVQIKKIRES
jgi:hypothetical protein